MSKWSSAFRDLRWQKKRLEIMERDGWYCQSCGKGGKDGKGVTLNVHHVYYEAGRAPWEYDNDTLVTWCEDCHVKRHGLQNLIMLHMAKATLESLMGLEAMAASYPESLRCMSGMSGILEDKDLSYMFEIMDKAYYCGIKTGEDLAGDQK